MCCILLYCTRLGREEPLSNLGLWFIMLILIGMNDTSTLRFHDYVVTVLDPLTIRRWVDSILDTDRP